MLKKRSWCGVRETTAHKYVAQGQSGWWGFIARWPLALHVSELKRLLVLQIIFMLLFYFLSPDWQQRRFVLH